MASRKGSKNKATVTYNDIKQRVIRSGMAAESERIDYLRREDPYLFLQVTNKLLKI